ncbi:MAG: SRPBCC family protein [Pseudolysinimonas sp.]
MGMLTHSRVEIAAPASEVFSWLTEPAKLTAWLGGAGGMPEDPSVLAAGWTSTTDVPPVGKTTIEIVTWDPPKRLDYLTTYTGGDSHTSYQVAEGDGVTTLVCESDTDWARPEGLWDSAIDKAAAGQSEEMRETLETQMDSLEGQLDAGAFDGIAQGQMQSVLDASLQKLKALIEAASPPAAS